MLPQTFLHLGEFNCFFIQFAQQFADNAASSAARY
jgi:hypothetical protein